MPLKPDQKIERKSFDRRDKRPAERVERKQRTTAYKTTPDLQVMVDAALKAGRRLMKDFREVENLQVSRKGPADFVSKADLMADKILKEELSYARPGYGFLTEESGETIGEKNARFIIDPLDGTTNFLHGLPHWAISIALEKEGELTAGVIYDPCKDEMFYAEKGFGAYCNRNILRVSKRDKMEEALLAIGFPFKGQSDEYKERFRRDMEIIMNETPGARRWGAAALDMAYVAAGRHDAYRETEISVWDVAAGVVLVQEAKGVVKDVDGKDYSVDSTSMMASNVEIYPKLLKLFK